MLFPFFFDERNQIKSANNKALIFNELNTETMVSTKCEKIEMFVWSTIIF